MIVNFRAREINWDTRKLTRISMLIKKKKSIVAHQPSYNTNFLCFVPFTLFSKPKKALKAVIVSETYCDNNNNLKYFLFKNILK